MGRLLAAAYDFLLHPTEVACLSDWRTELLAPLSGVVLEVGAGTGVNIAHYPTTVTKLVLSEPDRAMRRKLERRAAGRNVEVIDAAAEALPFADGAFDHVVATLVLCSVEDPRRVLAEIFRVLRPGGSYAFIEHVGAEDDTDRWRWQRRLEPVWKRIMGNCHVTRRTEDAIRAAGFELDGVRRESLRKSIPITRPSIEGSRGVTKTDERGKRSTGSWGIARAHRSNPAAPSTTTR